MPLKGKIRNTLYWLAVVNRKKPSLQNTPCATASILYNTLRNKNKSMESQTPEKWYENTVLVIVLLVLFFPIGLLLMWFKTQWLKPVKWIITALFALILFGDVIAFSHSSSLSAENKPVITKAPTLTPSFTPTPTKTPPTTPIPNAVTLDSLALVLVGFNVTQSNDRYIGYSNDGKSNITLIGDKNNIKTIMLSLSDIQSKDATYDSTLLKTTLQAVLPNWQGSTTWLENALTQFSHSTDPNGDSVETDVGNKHILLGYSPVNNSENLTITIK
jgi:hypothetical protein